MNKYEHLITKINQAKDLDFGDIINESIALFKQVWLKGFIVIILLLIPAMLLGFLFGLLGLSTSFSDTFTLDKFSDNYGFSLLISTHLKNVVFNIPLSILISTINLALIAGFYRICNAEITKKTQEDNYFYFFSKTYFSKVFMLGIIYTGIATLAQLLLYIPYIYVYVPLSFFAVILANNPELTEMEVVKASFALGNKKWLISFGTLILAGIMAALGVIACGVGLLFTLSLACLPVYLIYKNAIGIDNTDEIDTIGVSH